MVNFSRSPSLIVVITCFRLWVVDVVVAPSEVLDLLAGEVFVKGAWWLEEDRFREEEESEGVARDGDCCEKKE